MVFGDFVCFFYLYVKIIKIDVIEVLKILGVIVVLIVEDFKGVNFVWMLMLVGDVQMVLVDGKVFY